MPRKQVVIALSLVLAAFSSASAGLINSGFEYGQANNTWGDHNDASIKPSGGWFTTESDHQIEIWGNGFNGVTAYQGSNFAELNANAVGTLYQDTTGIGAGDKVDWHFAHRGRLGVDTMELKITDMTTNAVLFQNRYSDGNTAWGFYSGSFVVPAGVSGTDTIRFAYVSISAAGGSPTYGNFLDAADFGIGVNSNLSSVPEPGTFAGLAMGALGLVAARRRGRKSA